MDIQKFIQDNIPEVDSREELAEEEMRMLVIIT